MITKTCSRCGETKAIYDFYFYKTTNKHSSECKECKRKMNLDFAKAKKVKVETKTCSCCGEEKPLTEFYFSKTRNLYYAHCKECHKTYSEISKMKRVLKNLQSDKANKKQKRQASKSK